MVILVVLIRLLEVQVLEDRVVVALVTKVAAAAALEDIQGTGEREIHPPQEAVVLEGALARVDLMPVLEALEPELVAVELACLDKVQMVLVEQQALALLMVAVVALVAIMEIQAMSLTEDMAAYMVVAVLGQKLLVVVVMDLAVMAQEVQSALCGPVLPVHSHQLVQAHLNF
jgi:hypothetical protein